MKTFILLSALPGAGKSTWAEQYRLTHKHVFVVSSDNLRKELTGEFQNFTKEKEVWDLFFKRIIEYRDKYDDVTVIADSTNVENRFRLLYGKTVDGFDHKILVEIKKPYDLILEQNKQRSKNRIVPEYAMKRMFDNYEEPTQEVLDCYDEYIIIDKWFDSSKVKESFHYKG